MGSGGAGVESREAEAGRRRAVADEERGDRRDDRPLRQGTEVAAVEGAVVVGREEPELARAELEAPAGEAWERPTPAVDRGDAGAGHGPVVHDDGTAAHLDDVAREGQDDLPERRGTAGAGAGREIAAAEGEARDRPRQACEDERAPRERRLDR